MNTKSTKSTGNNRSPPVRISGRRSWQEEISKESEDCDGEDGNDDSLSSVGRLSNRNPPRLVRTTSPGLTEFNSTRSTSTSQRGCGYSSNSNNNNNNNSMSTAAPEYLSYEERLIEKLRDELTEKLRDEFTENLHAIHARMKADLRDELLSTPRPLETGRTVRFKDLSNHKQNHNRNHNHYNNYPKEALRISSTKHQQHQQHQQPQSSFLSESDEEDHKQFLTHLNTEMGPEYQYPAIDAIDIELKPQRQPQPQQRSSKPFSTRNSTSLAALAAPRKFFSSNYSTARENVTELDEIDGINSWVILVMTKPRDSFGSARTRMNTIHYYAAVYLTPFISWLLIAIQILVLNFLGYQSGLTYCKKGREAEDCQILGQVCSNGYVDHEDYFGDEIGLCIDNPREPVDHCPYLQNLMMPNSSKFVILVVFIYITSSVLHEMAQDYSATKAGRKLSQYNQCGLWVQFNIWCWHLLRGYFLPMMTYYAAVLILFVEADFRPSTILLNGVAVDVVLSFDDHMLNIFLPKATQAMIARKMGNARDIQFPEQQQTNPTATDEIAIGRKMWWHNRFLCLAFTIASLIAAFDPIQLILNVEKFLPFVPMEATSSTGYASCNDFALALGMALMWYSLLPLFIVLERYIHGSKVLAMVRDFILGWGFIYLAGFLLTVLAGPMHLSLKGTSYGDAVRDIATHDEGRF